MPGALRPEAPRRYIQAWTGATAFTTWIDYLRGPQVCVPEYPSPEQRSLRS